ncbi:hypothetical protein ACFOUP_16825 [Belliella kenyensis]|uniref:DUF4172 domain-containing protein n=1 Tax=Belliella kenyensis TaxID=1472724 RepID=A0ABV8ERT2_9BACT|nr:hypothetical protein [Belliella kenyensis]MCH7402887.1 hypothetical protein [Belliella kenyensis]MDN3602593.1 hypothetical protein [Belliella kenyensis]
MTYNWQHQNWPNFDGQVDRLIQVAPPAESIIYAEVYALQKESNGYFKKLHTLAVIDETYTSIVLPFPKAFEHFYWHMQVRLNSGFKSIYNFEYWDNAPEKIDLDIDQEVKILNKSFYDFQLQLPETFTYQMQRVEFKNKLSWPNYRRIYWEVFSKDAQFKIMEIPAQILEKLDYNPDLSNPSIMASIIFTENTSYEDHLNLLFKGIPKPPMKFRSVISHIE